MSNSNIKNIKVLKTMVDITLTNHLDRNVSPKDATIDLMLKSIACGASGNTLKALGVNMEKSDYESMEKARLEVTNTIYRLRKELGDKLEDIEPKNHTFR